MNMHTANFIDVGRWNGQAYISDWQRTSAGTLEVVDPANGTVLCSVGLGGPWCVIPSSV